MLFENFREEGHSVCICSASAARKQESRTGEQHKHITLGMLYNGVHHCLLVEATSVFCIAESGSLCGLTAFTYWGSPTPPMAPLSRQSLS